MMTNQSPSDKALYYMEAVMERAMAKYFLLGKTARDVYDSQENDLEGKVELGMLKQHLNDSTLSLLKQIIPEATFTPKKITLEHDGIPIEILIISKSYNFLKFPDVTFFKVTQFNIPNPFEEYWKVRSFVR